MINLKSRDVRMKSVHALKQTEKKRNLYEKVTAFKGFLTIQISLKMKNWVNRKKEYIFIICH